MNNLKRWALGAVAERSGFSRPRHCTVQAWLCKFHVFPADGLLDSSLGRSVWRVGERNPSRSREERGGDSTQGSSVSRVSTPWSPRALYTLHGFGYCTRSPVTKYLVTRVQHKAYVHKWVVMTMQNLFPLYILWKSFSWKIWASYFFFFFFEHGETDFVNVIASYASWFSGSGVAVSWS